MIDNDQENLEEEIKCLMASKVGRRFFMRIMDRGRVFIQSSAGIDRNPSMTAYRNGGRDLALSIYQDAEDIDPQGLKDAYCEFINSREYERKQSEQQKGDDKWMTMM